MKYGRYAKRDKIIAAADANPIRQRWEYGRDLLTDDSMTTPAGNLRNGVIDGLITAAHRIGCKLSEREIQHRLQAGKAYPTETQITHICTSYESWGALRTAGFPAVEAPGGEEPFDPRTAADRARDAARDLTRHGHDGSGQIALFDYFPDSRFDETSTLAELAKYADEMAELTQRYERRDRERAAYLKRLVDAVDGDMGATVERALAALGEVGGTA